MILYLISLPLQLVTTGALLEQGSTGLTAVTAVHAAVVATLFWSLLANGLIATQIVEDGTLSSLIVSIFCPSGYHPISLSSRVSCSAFGRPV